MDGERSTRAGPRAAPSRAAGSQPAAYRSTYHHGDARAALTGAALDLARRGGPRQVTLRAAARQVGVTAAAVYRHFATVDELLDAAKDRALGMLAEHIDDALPPAAPRGEPAVLDGARPHAVAGAYLAFARQWPGLFAMAGHGGADALRELVTGRLGRLPGPSTARGGPDPAEPPGAGLAVWSVVHGVAILAVDGSLRAAPEDEQRACLVQVLEIVLAGVRTRDLPGADPSRDGAADPGGPPLRPGDALRTI